MERTTAEEILALATALQVEAQRRGIVLDREDAILLALLCGPATAAFATAMLDPVTHTTERAPLRLIPTA